jgi:hypothetical protein
MDGKSSLESDHFPDIYGTQRILALVIGAHYFSQS